MEATTTEIRVLGRRIREVRVGRGRPLLYLHGGLADTIWLNHLLALGEHYEVHAPAHPGFLDSEGIEQIRDIEDLVYHYLAYLDAKAWTSVDVVGLSLGGWIAAEIAARYPERVSTLALVSSVGIWIEDHPIADIFATDVRFPERIQGLLFHDTNCEAAKLMSLPDFQAAPDEVLIPIMNAMAATAKVGWNPLLHNPKLERMLPRVTAPTLCLWGANDRVVPPVYAEKFARLIPQAQVEIVPDCGHLLPLEQKDAFVRAIRGFFR